MVNTDEISKNAIVLNANESKIIEWQTQISTLLYPNEGDKQDFNTFSNL